MYLFWALEKSQIVSFLSANQSVEQARIEADVDLNEPKYLSSSKPSLTPPPHHPENFVVYQNKIPFYLQSTD